MEEASRAIRLWGRRSSCNVQKVLWTLEELGLAYERIEAGGDHGGLDTPAYRQLNPHGRAPTLADGAVVVWESDAIVRYLAAAHGAGRLWSSDPAEQAQADQWMTWGTTEVEPDWLALFWRFVRTPLEKHDPKAIDRCFRATARRFEVLDQHLAHSPYVAGDRFTLGDISLGMMMYRWYEMHLDHPRLPHLHEWYLRLLSREAYRNAVCVPFDDLVGKETF